MTLGILAAFGKSALFQKATAGFEPAMGVLQTPALPLGDVAAGRPRAWPMKTRAGDGIRTHDLFLGKETFYH